VKYPELDKMAARSPVANQAISEFLEWLDTQGIVLARPDMVTKALPRCWHLPITERHESLLERFFGIDPVALENERRAMLADMRASA